VQLLCVVVKIWYQLGIQVRFSILNDLEYFSNMSTQICAPICDHSASPFLLNMDPCYRTILPFPSCNNRSYNGTSLVDSLMAARFPNGLLWCQIWRFSFGPYLRFVFLVPNIAPLHSRSSHWFAFVLKWRQYSFTHSLYIPRWDASSSFNDVAGMYCLFRCFYRASKFLVSPMVYILG
jgi:hypothetical protein